MMTDNTPKAVYKCCETLPVSYEDHCTTTISFLIHFSKIPENKEEWP